MEERTLLALAAFDVNLYEDHGGVPGKLIADDTVTVGQSFFVEITAEDLQPTPLGLGGISLDIAWDASIFAEIDEPFDPRAVITPRLPAFQFGTLENRAGRIDDLSGSSLAALGVGELVGVSGSERFALLRFRAIQAADSSPFSMRVGLHDIAFFPPIWDTPDDFLFEPQTITVVGPFESSQVESISNIETVSGAQVSEPAEVATPIVPAAESQLSVADEVNPESNAAVQEIVIPDDTENGIETELPLPTGFVEFDTPLAPENADDLSHLLGIDPLNIQLWYTGPQPIRVLGAYIAPVSFSYDVSGDEPSVRLALDLDDPSAGAVGPSPWAEAVDAFFAQSNSADPLLSGLDLEKRSCPVPADLFADETLLSS
ncbi:MAG: hypothetical protein ACC655_01865 [Rhodothermia bacterium]